MIDVILHTFFSVKGHRDTVSKQADLLMDALVDASDGGVFDPAISYDSDAEIAEIEVGARGSSRMDAEGRALTRISEAMELVGIPVQEMAGRRSVELVPA